MAILARASLLVLAGLLLSSCGDDGGADASDVETTVVTAGPTTVPEPTTVWVGSSETRTLLKVDPATRGTEEISVDDGPWKVEYVDGALWTRTPHLQRRDPATGQPSDVLFSEVDARDFLVDGDGIWMSLQHEAKLVRYDLATGKPEDEVQLPSEDLWLEDMTLAGDAMLGENSYDGTAVRIDLDSGEILGSYNPDAVIWDVQVNGDSLWVAHYDGLVELDAETLEPRTTIPGVEAAFALATDETGQVWVGLKDMIGTIDESSGQFKPTATIGGAAGGSVDDIEVSASSVWFAHEDAGLLRLDRATSQLDQPIPLPGAGAFAPTFEVALQ